MRVMIVEDDRSTSLLIEKVIRRLWPNCQLDCLTSVPDALRHWRVHGASLALIDIGLPGPDGIALLEQMSRDPAKAPLTVIVSGQTHRSVVLDARRYRARDYIVKPFRTADLMERLRRLAEADGLSDEADAGSPVVHATVDAQIQHAISASGLSLPIDPLLVEELELWHIAGQLDRTRVLDHWGQEPALVARLLGAANSGIHNPSDQLIETLGGAVDRLGGATVCNLAIALALHPGSPLEDADLRARATAYQAERARLAQTLRGIEDDRLTLADREACATAIALHRGGALAIAQQLQIWLGRGGTLDAAARDGCIQRHAETAAASLHRLWRIPADLSALVDAIDHPPPAGIVKHRQLLMHLAGLMARGADAATIAKLRARMG